MAERDTSLIAHDLRDTTAPDRNLALELVRCHGGRGAGRRPLGGARRQGVRRPGGGRRDALHAACRPDGRKGGDRRGGEGRGADALQRRADRGRQPARGRHRRRPARGHAPDGARHAERPVGGRAGRARHDVRPRPVRLHGEDRGRLRHRRPARSRPAAGRDPEADRQAARAPT